MKHTKNRKLLLYITVGAIFLLVFLRFGLFFLKRVVDGPTKLW